MKNYCMIFFFKGLPLYLSCLSQEVLKKYFILTLNVHLLKTLFFKKKLYFTNYTTLLFLVHWFRPVDNQVLVRNNVLLRMTTNKTSFEIVAQGFFKINDAILIKKTEYIFKKILFKQQNWKFTEQQMLLIKQGYRTNFVKIWCFENYQIWIYDINNHYAYTMSKNLPVSVQNIRQVNIKKNSGVVKTLDWVVQSKVFLNTVFGLTESLGIVSNFHVKKSVNNNINILLALYHFSNINFKKKKVLLRVLEYAKNIEQRKIKKKMLVKLYGQFATNYLFFLKKQCNPLPIFITNYSRNIMNRVVKALSPIYSDTDSLFLTKPIKKQYLVGHIGYVKNIFRNFIFFHLYVLNEKKYCGLILSKKKLFFLVTLNIFHNKNNFIKSYTRLFLYKVLYVPLGIKEKNWTVKSLYKKKLNIVNYSTLKLLKTLTYRL